MSGSENWSVEDYHRHMGKKRSKYGNTKCQHEDGTQFDSLKELSRYNQLLIEVRAGTIKDLECHPKFTLQASFKYQGETVRAITYRADFSYWDIDAQRLVVEDVKGGKATRTQLFAVKWKMAKFLYPETVWKIV